MEIRFRPQGTAQTRIDITHRGWERLGATGDQWRDRTQIGWHTLLPRYHKAVERR